MEEKEVKLGTKTKLLLGAQHVLAMFGATVLVPFITGLNPSIALIAAGVGTLVFHFCTKGSLSSIFRFIICFYRGFNFSLREEGIAAIKGGVVAAGIIYIIMSILVKIFGVKKLNHSFHQ